MIRGPAGQVAIHVEPLDGIDLQFIYRAALSIYWNSAEALLEDRSSAVESSEASAARIARALRDENGMQLRPSDNVQWKEFSAQERNGSRELYSATLASSGTRRTAQRAAAGVGRCVPFILGRP